MALPTDGLSIVYVVPAPPSRERVVVRMETERERAARAADAPRRVERLRALTERAQREADPDWRRAVREDNRRFEEQLRQARDLRARQRDNPTGHLFHGVVRRPDVVRLDSAPAVVTVVERAPADAAGARAPRKSAPAARRPPPE